MTDESVIEKNILKRLKRSQSKKAANAILSNLAGLSEKPDPKALGPESEIQSAVDKSAYKKRRDIAKKKRARLAIGLVAASLFSYWVYTLFVPYKANATYGVCKVFLELKARYPETIQYSEIEEFATSIRIWYADVDPFGEYKVHPIQCFFKEDQTYGWILDKVTMDRREIDPLEVQAFNRSYPVVLKNLPDLAYPDPLPDSLEDLKINPYKFMKPILDHMPSLSGDE